MRLLCVNVEFVNFVCEYKKWCCNLFVFAWFRVAVWRCVQYVGDNMGSQAYGFKPLCPLHCPGTGWVLQRHYSQQQHGLHWYNQILQRFVPKFKSVTVIFLLHMFSAFMWALNWNMLLLCLSFCLQKLIIIKSSW